MRRRTSGCCSTILEISDVLVVPNRVVPRLRDLSGEEIADVFQTAEMVGKVIEKEFGGESLTVACQVRAEEAQT